MKTDLAGFIRSATAFVILAGGSAALAQAVEPDQAERRLLEQQAKLLTINSVFVDPLGGEEGSVQIRDMIIGSLQRSGLFTVTEDEEHADAFLRGSAEDLIYLDHFSSRDGLQVRGGSSSSRREDGDSRFDSSNFGIGENERQVRRERKHEAMAAVRLVLRNGEVIWSTTEESAGGKYLGAAADVADRVAKALAKAFEAASKQQQGHQQERPSRKK